ncbi:spore maturation protein CgeB [Lachnospiraceae bacterium XPB1003]|nr:spore maturation protein CgeB [Lachnospiraceae bacterium XPB1003]
MTVLYMDWPGYGSEYIKKTFEKMGFKVVVFDFPQNSNGINLGTELAEKIVKAIVESKADFVFSLNYFPVIATAVQACHIKYLSWIYDNPAVLTYSMTVFFEGNHIFHFDSSEVEKLRNAGVANVYYLPLSADTGRYDAVELTDDDRAKYGADVAMIGSMYTEDKFRIFRKYEKFDDYIKGYLDALVKAQESLYGADILEPGLEQNLGDGSGEKVIDRILKSVPLSEHGDSFSTPQWVFANYYLAMRVTANERRHVMEAVADAVDGPVALYTRDASFKLGKVINRGNIDYYEEFPKAVKAAKVNLNISLKSIHTGIPLRVIDIMACGGFVLSNYQADLFSEFVPDEDFVYYENVKDAAGKAAYYASHDEERMRIAANGYRKVREEHNFIKKLTLMTDAAGLTEYSNRGENLV